MDNNDNHLKAPQTGGLKLMTVFIVVLALHVVVIGGFTVYHLMSGGGTDADLVGDKAHKNVKIAADPDSPLPDATSPDKTAANPSATTPAPDADASTPAPAATASTPAPATPAPDASATAAVSTPAPDASMTAAATPAPGLAPAPASTASAPSGPIASGPVITPPAPVQNDQTAEQEAVAPPTALDGDIAPPVPYMVKTHDSLAKIAKRHHVAVAKLREMNNLKSDLLHVGQKLMIPGTTTEAVAASDAPAKTPAASHEPNRTLLGDSIPDEPSPSKKTVASTARDEALIMPASSSHHTYTVVKGDTLTRIAHKFHTTTSALLAMNGSLDARKLRIGQKLHIPSQEPRSANIAPAPAPMLQPEAPKPQPEPAEVQPSSAPSAQLANFMP